MKVQCFLPLIVCGLIGTSCSRSSSHFKSLNWDAKTSTFAWPGGEVKMPRGFTHHGGEGLDTFEGHFSSPDGKLVIRYDIGWYAGARASPNGASSFEERLMKGARVWTAQRKRPDGRGGNTTDVAVTFLDAGCANFFLDSPRVEDAELIAHIAETYRPSPPRVSGARSSCEGVPGDDPKK